MKLVTPLYLVVFLLLNSISIFGMQLPATQGSNSNNANGMPLLMGDKTQSVGFTTIRKKINKNITCGTCGKQGQPHQIQTHINKTHTKEATFVCRRKRCNQWFIDYEARRLHEDNLAKVNKCGFSGDELIDKSKELINGKITDACEFNKSGVKKVICEYCVKKISINGFSRHEKPCAEMHNYKKASPEIIMAVALAEQAVRDTSSSNNNSKGTLPQLVKASFEEAPKKPNLRKRTPKKKTDEMEVAALEETSGDDLSPTAPFVTKRIDGKEIKVYVCHHCVPLREFDRSKDCQSHINSVHTHEKTFACPNKGCWERFETYWHMRDHSINKFACSFLNSINPSKQHKSFLCLICGRSLKSGAGLAQHMTKHTGKNQEGANTYNGILNKGPSPEPSEQSMSDQSELPAPAQLSNAQPLATPVAAPIIPQVANSKSYSEQADTTQSKEVEMPAFSNAPAADTPFMPDFSQPIDQTPNPFMQQQRLPFFDNEELVDLPTNGLSELLTMPSDASIDIGIAEHGSGNSDPGARRSDPGIAAPFALSNSHIPLANPIKDSDSPMFLAPAVEDGATHSAESSAFRSSGLFDSFVPKNDFGMDDLPPITNSSNNNGNANNPPHQLLDYSDEEEDELSEADVAGKNNGSTNSGGKTRPAQLTMKPKKSSGAAYYHCHHCKTNFDEIDQIKKHIKAEHPGELATYFEKIKLKKFPFECPHDACDFATRSKKSYENHMNNEHDSEKLSSDSSKRVAGVKRKLEEATEESTQPENSKAQSYELPTVHNSKKHKSQ